jgi:hypothetical protein
MRRDGAGVRGPAPPAQKKELPRRVLNPEYRTRLNPAAAKLRGWRGIQACAHTRRDTLKVVCHPLANAACMGIDYAVVPTFRDSVAAVAA